MTDNTHSAGDRTVYVKRPSSALVAEIGQRLAETVDEVRRSELIAAIQCETGCSRATAYRALRDFLEHVETSHGDRFMLPGATSVGTPPSLAEGWQGERVGTALILKWHYFSTAREERSVSSGGPNGRRRLLGALRVSASRRDLVQS